MVLITYNELVITVYKPTYNVCGPHIVASSLVGGLNPTDSSQLKNRKWS